MRMPYGMVLVLWMGLVACQAEPLPMLASDPHVQATARDAKSDEVSSETSRAIPLALYPLKNMGGPTPAGWIGPMLTDLMMSDLVHWSYWRLISRESTSAVLREQWLQYQPSHSAETIRLGQMQGARFIVQGGFVEQDGHVTVDLQIIDVETGLVWDTVRVEGRRDALPRLEQELVSLLVKRLPRQEDLRDATTSGSQTLADTRARSGRTLKDLEDGDAARESPSQVVVREEMALLLDSRRQRRLQLTQATHNLFKQGFTVEVGRPYYPAEAISGGQGNTKDSRLFLPVALYAKKSKLLDLLAHEISSEWAATVLEAQNAHPDSYSEQDLVDRRWFVEQVSRPRRLFVRARSGQGEVVAVFSRWDWRMDRVISFTEQGLLSMPWWPKPLLLGLAEFPIQWLERGEPVVTFDTVMVDVNPDERDVAVEWVNPRPAAPVPSEHIATVEQVEHQLRAWIQQHWIPLLGETLPFKGYLPSNKPLATLRLQVEQGIITHLDHQFSSSDPVFIGSIHELTEKLVGACPWCETAQKIPEILNLAEFRLQCTVLKPTQLTGLGSRLP